MTIKTRMTILSGVLATLILAAVVSALTIRARSQLLEQATADLAQTAQGVARQIDRWDELIITASHAVTGNPEVRRMNPSTQGSALAGAATALEKYVYTVYTISADGQDISTLTGFMDNVFSHYEAVGDAFEETTGAMSELLTGADEIGRAVVSLRDTTHGVETGAQRITEQSDQIKSHTGSACTVSSVILNGVDEIDLDTSEISTAMQELTDADSQLSAAIGRNVALIKTDAQ